MKYSYGIDPVHEDYIYDIMGELGVTFARTNHIPNFDLNESVFFLFKHGLTKENAPHFFCFFMGSYLIYNDVYKKFGTLDFILNKAAGAEDEPVYRGLVELLRRKVDGDRNETVKASDFGSQMYKKMQKLIPFRTAYPDEWDDDFQEIFGVKMFKLAPQPSRKYYLREHLAKQRPEIWG